MVRTDTVDRGTHPIESPPSAAFTQTTRAPAARPSGSGRSERTWAATHIGHGTQCLNGAVTSFGDLLGPQPVLLTGDDEAESELLDGTPAAAVAAAHPTASIAWAHLAEAALDAAGGDQTPNDRGTGDQAPGDQDVAKVVEAYAYARTGYHRGLDQLRRHGWKGFGPVPWSHEPNQGFLRCVGALARAAQAIGEEDEYLRCLDLLNDSDPAAAAQLGLA